MKTILITCLGVLVASCATAPFPYSETNRYAAVHEIPAWGGPYLKKFCHIVRGSELTLVREEGEMVYAKLVKGPLRINPKISGDPAYACRPAEEEIHFKKIDRSRLLSIKPLNAKAAP